MNWNKSLKGRLMLAAILPLIGFGALFGAAQYGFKTMQGIVDELHQDTLPSLNSLAEMRVSRNKFALQAWGILADWEKPEKRAKREALLLEAYNEYTTAYDFYKKKHLIPGEAELHDKVKDQMPTFIQASSDIMTAVKGTTPEDLIKVRALLDGDFSKIGSQIRDFNRDVNVLYLKAAEEDEKHADALLAQINQILIAISLFSGAVIFGILTWIATRVSSSVGSISENITGAGDKVSVSVEHLNAASQSLSTSALQAAGSLQETVAALEEITAMVQKNSENATEAAKLSSFSKMKAHEGEQEIKSLIGSMKQIADSSKKIEEIIAIIDDIAFQTNILALNAAVESARAGEHGKGFGVVADAVRSLAHRSSDAAKDITGLIKTSVQQIEMGSAIADQSGVVLGNIVTSVQKVAELNEAISLASREQAQGVEQINIAMTQIDASVQSNATAAEQVASAGEKINVLMGESRELSSELNKMIYGQETQEKKAA